LCSENPLLPHVLGGTAVHDVAEHTLWLWFVLSGTQLPLLHWVPLVQVLPLASKGVLQVLFEHVEPEGHTFPQPPQLWMSLLVLTHVKPHVVGLQQEVSPPLHFPPPASAGSAITAAPAAPPIITPPNRRRASRRDSPSSSRRERPPASLRAKRSSRCPPSLGICLPGS
jgi:hypothetical protein